MEERSSRCFALVMPDRRKYWWRSGTTRDTASMSSTTISGIKVVKGMLPILFIVFHLVLYCYTLDICRMMG